MRRTFLWINFVLASLIVVLIFLQAYFITAYIAGAGESALDAHSFTGFALIHGAELLVFLTAFGAWPRAWKWIAYTFSLFVVGTIQIFLTAGRGADERLAPRSPWTARSRRDGDGGRDRAPRPARPRAQTVFVFARR